jgi:hypothetical protein
MATKAEDLAGIIPAVIVPMDRTTRSISQLIVATLPGLSASNQPGWR